MLRRRQLIATGLSVVFLAGCAGTGLREVGVPDPPWQGAPQEELRTADSARVPLFSPVPFPGRSSQEERWRCEVRWRCFDTDDDTGARTELIDSGTAWYEDAGSRGWVCSRAKAQLAGGWPCNTGHPDHYELEKDDECSCSRPGR